MKYDLSATSTACMLCDIESSINSYKSIFAVYFFNIVGTHGISIRYTSFKERSVADRNPVGSDDVSLIPFLHTIYRAVTTIEAASSDFLKKKNPKKPKKPKNKKKQTKTKRERERKKKSKRQDIDFCSSKGYIRYVMRFRIFFYAVSQMLDLLLLISRHISEIKHYL